MKAVLSALGFLGIATSLSAQDVAAAASTSAPTPVNKVLALTPADNPSYPQPPHDKHENDIPRYTQMGTVAVAGAPGNGRYFPPVPADPKLPTLWVIGDSTVRNGTLGDGVGNMDQWGWGAPFVWYFDAKKINVVNRAFGGTSARSFYEGFFWKNLQPQIKKGDFVIFQFGANDNGQADLPGTGDDTRDVAARGGPTTLHSFGWYLKQFVAETRAQGGTCIICSLTPRKNWLPNGHMRRDDTTHVAWAAQVAKDTNAPFVNLYELIERKYDQLGQAAVDHLYTPWPSEKNPKGEGLHTGWEGAIANAECVISGLKALKDDPLAPYFSDKVKDIPAVDVSQPEAPLKAAPPAASGATTAKPARSAQ